jgi:hypothetical protein
MPPSLYICPNFWKEVDFLLKKTKNRLLVPEFELSEDSNSLDRIEATPILKVITTFILQTSGTQNDQATKVDKQPFLDKGWVIYKLRYAFDRNGKSSGLRIIFCKSETSSNILLVYMNLKAYCTDEKDLEKESIERISEYLSLGIIS